MSIVETVSFSSRNSRTLLDGVTDFGLVEQQGRFCGGYEQLKESSLPPISALALWSS